MVAEKRLLKFGRKGDELDHLWGVYMPVCFDPEDAELRCVKIHW